MSRWSSENEGFLDGVIEVSVQRIERENRPTLVEIVIDDDQSITLTLQGAKWVADRIHDAAALEGEHW
jgi:hypothetical protein